MTSQVGEGMAPGSVLVKQGGSQHCLLPGSWRIGLGKEKWEGEGGEAVCPSLSLSGAPWRGWQVRRGEENREVVRACALPRCGAMGGTTHQGDSARPGIPHEGQAGGRGSSWRGPRLGSVWDRKHPEVGEGGRKSCWVSAREVARLRPRVK